MNEAAELASDLPMVHRDLDRIQPDRMVMVSYFSSRSTYWQHSRSGTIESVHTEEDGNVQFRFFDDEHERDIDVTIGSTTGESTIKSKKTENWTTLGTPVRITVHEDANGRMDMMNKSVAETYEGRYESVVAVASIEWNDQILKWFEWSEANA